MNVQYRHFDGLTEHNSITGNGIVNDGKTHMILVQRYTIFVNIDA